MPVKNKNKNLVRYSGEPWVQRLREFRKRMGWTQGDLADLMGVSQGAVARWETGLDRPPALAFMEIGRYDHSNEKFWFDLAGTRIPQIERAVQSFRDSEKVAAAARTPVIEVVSAAGMNSESIQKRTSAAVAVPLLKDSAAAGTGRFIEEKDVEDVLVLPSTWAPHPDGTKCIKISGNSMSPILEDGYIVAIDTTLRDPKKLVNEMVAARDPDGGVTIKWLRYSKHYLLVAQHTSVDYNPQILSEESGWEIIGCVMWWIGKPPKKKRNRK